MTPSTAQLEVVRRLPANAESLAELVLTTPVGGRGWVDPAGGGVTDRELLRVCVAVLARWCQDQPAAAAEPPKRSRRWRPRVPYLVAGCSPHASAVRAALTEAGHSGGGLRKPTVLVVGGALDAMVASDWRRRVDAGSGVRWRRVWSVMQARDQLPATTDLVAQAQQHLDVWGADRVHVVLAPDPSSAVQQAAEILDVSLTHATDLPAHPVDTDLLRLVNQALAAKDPLVRRPQLRRPWPGGFGAPTAQLDWAVSRASALAEALRDGPWQLHGDATLVVPSTDAGLARTVSPSQTLALALDVLGRLEGGGPWPAR